VRDAGEDEDDHGNGDDAARNFERPGEIVPVIANEIAKREPCARFDDIPDEIIKEKSRDWYFDKPCEEIRYGTERACEPRSENGHGGISSEFFGELIEKSEFMETKRVRYGFTPAAGDGITT